MRRALFRRSDSRPWHTIKHPFHPSIPSQGHKPAPEEAMSAVPHQPAANDPDSLETQEWLDALEAVLEREGAERAHYLLEKLIEKSRTSGAYLPFSPYSPYV